MAFLIKVPKQVAQEWAVAESGAVVGQMVTRLDGCAIMDVVGKAGWTSIMGSHVMGHEAWLLDGDGAVTTEGIKMLAPRLALPAPRGHCLLRRAGVKVPEQQRTTMADGRVRSREVMTKPGDLVPSRKRQRITMDEMVEIEALEAVFAANNDQPMSVTAICKGLTPHLNMVPSPSVVIACLRINCNQYGDKWRLM